MSITLQELLSVRVSLGFSSPSILGLGLTKLCWNSPGKKLPTKPRRPYVVRKDGLAVAGQFNWPTELKAFSLLQKVLPNSGVFHFYSNVLLADIIEVDVHAFNTLYTTNPFPPGEQQTALNKLQGQIGNKRIDFLVVNAKSNQIYFGLEIDGEDHVHETKSSLDFEKSMLFRAHNLPLLRVYTSRTVPLTLTTFPQKVKSAAIQWNEFKKNPNPTTLQLHIPQHLYAQNGWHAEK